MNVRLLTLTLINVACATATATEFFVAPNGNDQNSGTRSKPFASFQRAHEAVRAERANHPQNAVTVTFREEFIIWKGPLNSRRLIRGSRPLHQSFIGRKMRARSSSAEAE